MQNQNAQLRKIGLGFLIVFIMVASSIPAGRTSSSLQIQVLSPSNGATMPQSDLTLAVLLMNSTSSRPSVGNYTEFYVDIPGLSSSVLFGADHSSSTGTASIPFNPPFCGAYSWYVKVDTDNDTDTDIDTSSSPWAFTSAYSNCGPATVTTTQTTGTTRTVAAVTVSSYIYATQTQSATVYNTQTYSTTTTKNSLTTIVTTTTGFQTTTTIPITTSQTISTTQTQSSYTTKTTTQYVYIESYVLGQSSETASIQQIQAGSNGSATFNKSNEHNIQRITIAAKNNVNNVTITVRDALMQGTASPGGMDYKYLEITATNLADYDISQVRIEFKVDRTWLTSNHVPDDQVNLYRYNNATWTKLPTHVLSSDENYVYYEATSPGFSLYAIASEFSPNSQLPWFGVELPAAYYIPILLAVVGIVGALAGFILIRTKRRERQLEKVPVDSEPIDAEMEDRVLGYITSHGGSISMARASKDLNLQSETISQIIERLNRDGRLKPT